MILREACKQREENLANARILAQKLGEMTEKKNKTHSLYFNFRKRLHRYGHNYKTHRPLVKRVDVISQNPFTK